MDNVTHSLVGITVGELWYLTRRDKKPQCKRSAVVATSLVANNLPDLDFIYAYAADVNLGYLLHHRGHTHTIVFALLVSMFPWLAEKLDGKPWRWVRKFRECFLVGGLGIVLHVVLDSLNSYGVHPFWPLWNRWFYLDTLFILEPLGWVTLLPAILFTVKRRRYRLLLAVCFFGILAAAWATPFVSVAAALSATVVGLAAWYRSQHAGELQRYRFAAFLFLGVVTVFAISGRLVQWSYTAKSAADHPERRLAEVALSPLPGDPFCWLIIPIELDATGNAYYLRRGIAAALPWLSPVSRCPSFRSERGLAPMAEVSEPDVRRYRWSGEHTGDFKELKNLAENHCQVRGFLSFSRVPFLVDRGDEWLVGDLRFDFDQRMSFAHFVFPKHPDTCPETTVPWTPPWHRW